MRSLHVVIPTADEPRNGSLPYALASIARHTDYTPVTVGHDHGSCDHIPTTQLRGRVNAFTNTDIAIRTACETDWISDPFIWSADDIYWMRPAEPVRWAIGKLEDAEGRTVYVQRKHDTANLLTGLGLPTFDYEAHVPMLIHKPDALDALELGGSFRSMYGNLTGEPEMIAPDVKLRNYSAPLPPAPWVSTHGNPHRYQYLRAVLCTGAEATLKQA